MTYVKTKLQHSIDIDAIITLHYFEYMKNFEFKGESHNFWEFLYVDKGTVAVRADDTWTTLYTGDIIFHSPNEFHAIKSIGKESAGQERLSEILKYLEYHICEKLTVKDICNEFSMSRSAVQLLFHEQLNCGVIDYFNQMKIQRAKDIIRDGSMNLTEIAYFLSYSSLPYFSKQFRLATGMSPSAYASSIKGITDAVYEAGERNRDL